MTTNPFIHHSQAESGNQLVPINTDNYLVSKLSESVQLNPEQIEKLEVYSSIAKQGFGLISGPMICSSACPYMAKCPIHLAGIPLPTGKDCPVEWSLLKSSISSMARSLGIDLDGDNIDPFDAMLLNDLGVIILIEKRALEEMSSSPNTAPDMASGFDPSDNSIIYKPQMNPRVSLLEKLAKMKNRIMKELIATRKAKIDSAGKYRDASSIGAELLEKWREKAKKKVSDVTVVDAEFEVKKDE